MSVSTDRVIKWVGIVVLIVLIIYIFLLVFSVLVFKGLRDDKYYKQIYFTQEEIGIAADELGVQDDIIKLRSLLVAFMDDYHPIKLLFQSKRAERANLKHILILITSR